VNPRFNLQTDEEFVSLELRAIEQASLHPIKGAHRPQSVFRRAGGFFLRPWRRLLAALQRLDPQHPDF
jgi:hypothetical protein